MTDSDDDHERLEGPLKHLKDLSVKDVMSDLLSLFASATLYANDTIEAEVTRYSRPDSSLTEQDIKQLDKIRERLGDRIYKMVGCMSKYDRWREFQKTQKQAPSTFSQTGSKTDSHVEAKDDKGSGRKTHSHRTAREPARRHQATREEHYTEDWTTNPEPVEPAGENMYARPDIRSEYPRPGHERVGARDIRSETKRASRPSRSTKPADASHDRPRTYSGNDNVLSWLRRSLGDAPSNTHRHHSGATWSRSEVHSRQDRPLPHRRRASLPVQTQPVYRPATAPVHRVHPDLGTERLSRHSHLHPEAAYADWSHVPAEQTYATSHVPAPRYSRHSHQRQW